MAKKYIYSVKSKYVLQEISLFIIIFCCSSEQFFKVLHITKHRYMTDKNADGARKDDQANWVFQSSETAVCLQLHKFRLLFLVLWPNCEPTNDESDYGADAKGEKRKERCTALVQR